MIKLLFGSVLLTTCFVVCSSRANSAEPQLAHMVFFKVSAEPANAKEKLAEACKKYLSGHEGVIYFSVGVRAKDMTREVNDQQFDVALHLVFKNKAAHDKYAEHPRHMKFIEENAKLWSAVRVMDSYLLASPRAFQPKRIKRLEKK